MDLQARLITFKGDEDVVPFYRKGCGRSRGAYTDRRSGVVDERIDERPVIPLGEVVLRERRHGGTGKRTDVRLPCYRKRSRGRVRDGAARGVDRHIELEPVERRIPGEERVRARAATVEYEAHVLGVRGGVVRVDGEGLRNRTGDGGRCCREIVRYHLIYIQGPPVPCR